MIQKWWKLILKKCLSTNQLIYISRNFEKIKSRQPNEKFLYPVVTYKLKNKDVFFGYYDINPCLDDKNILAMSVDTDNNAEILICGDGKIKTIATTKAWCWQQGCRLRWIYQNNRPIICWNDFIDNNYVSQFMDYQTRKIKTLGYPLYDILTQGDLGVMIDFQRLGYLRPGYGYKNLPFDNKITLQDYAIKLIDLNNFTVKMIISYADIMSLIDDKVELSMYYINHVSFNPSGNVFLFFFVQVDRTHKANLIIYDIRNKRLKILESELSVSHYCWISDTEILVTAYNTQRQCRYYIYDIHGDKKNFMHDKLIVDGHPTWVNPSCLITDTYPDKKGFQSIYKIDTLNNTIETLAQIYTSPKRLGEERTDLHPRVDLKNHIVCFDSNVKGNRTFCVMKRCCKQPLSAASRAAFPGQSGPY